MLTQERVKELFNYHEGKLYRRVSLNRRFKIGTEVGYTNQGYKKTEVDGVAYLIHRVIFLMHHGYLPQYVDHINGDTLDNHIENLREATRAQNNRNCGIRTDNTSGAKGVSYNKQSRKWRVRISVSGVSKFIGHYDTVSAATQSAIEARNKYHKEFANHG